MCALFGEKCVLYGGGSTKHVHTCPEKSPRVYRSDLREALGKRHERDTPLLTPHIVFAQFSQAPETDITAQIGAIVCLLAQTLSDALEPRHRSH